MILIKFYKIYDVKSDFLGIDVNNLRHIITPTAHYSYVHQPTISPDNLNQFDAIDAIDTSNGVTLALENRLQTKRRQGENWTSVDLVTFIVSTPYNFRLKKDNWGFKSQKFETVDFLLEVAPYPWLYAQSKASVNTKRAIMETESVDVVANYGDRWSLGIGQRYENTTLDASNLMTFDVVYKINDKTRTRHRFNY